MKNLTDKWRELGFREEDVRAFEEVDRSMFVIPEFRDLSYEDMPLPLLRGKTISQPTTMMIMTYALELEPDDKVLEVGTGSGYQAAVIGKIAQEGKVISTEVIPELVQYSRERLRESNIDNVEVYETDGSLGMPSEAPFDKIIITAAAKEFPAELIDQLKVNGIIVGPLGNKESQNMVKAVKREEGGMEISFLGDFLFTPLYGKYGFEI